MKVLQIQRRNRVLAEIPLTQESIYVGRCPICDFVLRTPDTKDVHFVIEKFDLNDDTKWALFKTPDNPSESKDGLFVDSNEQSKWDFDFKVIEGNPKLHKQNKTKIITTSFSKLLENQTTLNSRNVLEVIAFNNKSGFIYDVLHNPLAEIESNYLENLNITIKSTKNNSMILQSNSTLKVYSLKTNEFLEGPQYTLEAGECFKINQGFNTYFLKISPEKKLIQTIVEKEKSLFITPLLLTVPLFFLILFAGIQILSMETTSPEFAEKTPELEIEIKDPTLTAQKKPKKKKKPKEIVKKALPPKPVKPKEIIPPKKIVKQAKKPKAQAQNVANKRLKNVQKSRKNSSPFKKVGRKQSYARANNPDSNRKPITKSAVSLNSPAPQKQVNQVGLLAAVGSHKKIESPKISANNLYNNAIKTRVLAAKNSENNAVKITTPQSGAFSGNSKIVKNIGNSKNDLVSASTTLSGSRGSSGRIRLGSAGGSGSLNSGNSGKSFGGNGSLNGRRGGSGSSGNGRLGGAGAGAGGAGFKGSFSSSNTEVSGGLGKDVVRKYVRAQERRILKCYNKLLTLKPHLKGRIKLQWRIAPNGGVGTVSTLSNSTGDGSLSNCVSRVIKNIRFPSAANGNPTVVKYPFQFKNISKR